MSEVTWRRSSRCGESGQCVEVAWHRACTSASHCVEVARSDRVMMRDSKDPDGGVLAFDPADWEAFLAGLRAGEFDRAAR